MYNNEIPNKYDLIKDTLCTNKLYKKDFLFDHKLFFDNSYILEDKLFILKVLESSQNFSIINEVVHYWSVVNDSNSLTNILTIKSLKARMKINRKCISATKDEQMKLVLIENIIKHDLKIYVNHSQTYTLRELLQLYNLYASFIIEFEKYINNIYFKKNKKIIKYIARKYFTIHEFLNISNKQNKIDLKVSHHIFRDKILKILLKLENFRIKYILKEL